MKSSRKFRPESENSSRPNFVDVAEVKQTDSGTGKPMAVELYAGTGSGTAGWCELGGRAVCFDLEYLPHHGEPHPNQERRVRDVLDIHGSEFKDAAWIWASPPCQNYSYLAMPWSRSKDPENSKAAKALRKKWETEGPDNRLFDACFRIQREAIEATLRDCPDCAGWAENRFGNECGTCRGTGEITRYIPLIVENVRGAVPWVGQQKAKFGSFYLWGDVEQLGNRVIAGRDLADIRAGRGRFGMGVAPEKGNLKGYGSTWFGIQNNGDTYDQRSVNPVSGANKVPGFRFDGSGRSFQTASVEATKSNPDGTNHPQGSWFRIADSKQGDRGQKVPAYSDPRRNGGKGVHLTSPRENELGTKQPAGNGDWFSKEARDGGSSARHGSKSNARKAASALIAKIPGALSRYIAEQHFPV